jgi:hypothetical protein
VWVIAVLVPPGPTDNVTIFPPAVTLDQNVAVKQITLASGTLNASNFTITLTATEPILLLLPGTFNAGTSTVKLSNADHSFSTSSFTFYNLQWATPLTAQRTLAINGNNLTITRAAGGTFNLDGTPTNPVTFEGTGNFASMVTVNNCAGKPLSMTNVTCNPPASPQTITFNALPNKIFGDAPFPLGATASSGLAGGLFRHGQLHGRGGNGHVNRGRKLHDYCLTRRQWELSGGD